MELKTCIICGKQFTTLYSQKTMCSDECYRERTNQRKKLYRLKRKEQGTQVNNYKPELGLTVDLKLYEILNIMYEYDITIQEYMSKREFYKDLYLMRAGTRHG